MSPREQGTILVMTLWVLALLSLLAFATVTRVQWSIRNAAHDDTELRCRQMLSTLAQVVAARLSYDPDTEIDCFMEPWGRIFAVNGATIYGGFPDTAPQDEDLRLSIVAVDESAKINVNEANRALLVQVLRETAAAGAAEAVADAIVDWRDEDDLGVYERDAYADRALPCAPPNKALARIEELLYVQGVTPELYFGEDANHNGLLDPEEDDGSLYLPIDNADGQLQPGLADLLTVQGEAEINVNTCSAPVLRALLGYAATGSDYDRVVQALLQSRRGADGLDGTDDDKPIDKLETLAAILGPEVYQAVRDADIEFGLVSSAFRFYLRASVPSQHVVREADVLVARAGEELKMLEWHEGQ
jgi:type II secretory pathway component PulK